MPTYVEVDTTSSANLIGYLNGFTVTLFSLLSIIIALMLFTIFIRLFNRRVE